MEYTFFIGTFIGMRTKVITLSLDQVSWQNCGTITIVVSYCGRERRYRNTILHGISHHITQRLLIVISDLFEVWCQQEVSNASVLRISIGDLLQELRTNDAASAENLSDLAVVKIPVVFIRSSTQLGEALSIGDDFTEVQRATHFFDKSSFITGRLGLRTTQHFRRGYTLVFKRRNIASKYGLGYQRQRFAEIQ